MHRRRERGTGHNRENNDRLEAPRLQAGYRSYPGAFPKQHLPVPYRLSILPVVTSLGSIVSSGSFSLRSSLIATVVEDGAVLLDLETKYFYQLNASAWAVAQLFESGGATLADVEAACRNWGAPDATTAACEIVERFEREGLIEPAAPARVIAPAFEGTWVPPALARQSEPLQALVTSAFDPSIPLAE
jgi:hypothetical protein